MFGVITPLCNRIFCCIFGQYFYVKSGWNLKKIFCCPALELFHCLPLWKTVRLHGKKLHSFSFSYWSQWWEIGYKSFNSLCFTHNFFNLNFPDYELVSDGKILQTLTIKIISLYILRSLLNRSAIKRASSLNAIVTIVKRASSFN